MRAAGQGTAYEVAQVPRLLVAEYNLANEWTGDGIDKKKKDQRC